ncbi:MAG: energy transducer TonB [Planctomycetota bacterium]
MIARARTRILQRRRWQRNLALACLLGALLWWMGLLAASGLLRDLDAPVPAPPVHPLRVVASPPAPRPPAPAAAAEPAAPVAAAAPALPALPTVDLTGGALAVHQPAPDLPGLALELPAMPAPAAPPAAVAPVRPARLLAAPAVERFYPRAARLRGIAGSTLLELEISAAGRVSACTVLRSDPSGIFEGAARRLARDLHYQPRLENGVAVPCRTRLRVQWELQR